MAGPARGDIWIMSFDPVIGHEQAGRRPALVLSVDLFNRSPAELVVVAPVTSKSKGIRWHVTVNPPEGGLPLVSYIKCEDVRSVSLRRMDRKMGTVSAATMAAVEDRLRILLGL